MRTGVLATIASALVLFSCEEQAEATTKRLTQEIEKGANASSFADRSIGGHTVTGVLHAFEDTAFPLYSLEIGPSGSKQGDAENLQLGALAKDAGGTADADAIRSLVGDAVRVRYSVTEENGMVDLALNGEVIATGGPATADARTLQGVLSGAQSRTAGDLPSEVTVTAPDGSAVTFALFVDDSVVAANGRTVTLRYDTYPAVDLVSIESAG